MAVVAGSDGRVVEVVVVGVIVEFLFDVGGFGVGAVAVCAWFVAVFAVGEDVFCHRGLSRWWGGRGVHTTP